MSQITLLLATLRFEGRRFQNHALDVDCVSELQAYKQLVVECAKAIWHRLHTERERLPKGFEEDFVLGFAEIREGSAMVPLLRVLPRGQADLDLGALDEFDQAAALIDSTIGAAGVDALLPPELPPSLLPHFAGFGRSLREDEVVHVRARTSPRESAYTAVVRRKLTDWREASYEDRIDLTGEVSMANVRGASFSLVLLDRQMVSGKFAEEQEIEVLEALRSHRTARLRIRGVGEFSASDRSLRRIVRVDDVSLVSGAESGYVEGVTPIWQTVRQIGESVPEDVWRQVPEDLAARLHEHLYPRREPD
jgi:hypothetical protein